LSRSIFSAHVLAGVWAGVAVGAVLGALASFLSTPISFLLYVANEVLVTGTYRFLSQGLAASLSVPFAFFAMHFAMGLAGGAIAGAALGVAAAARRAEPRGLWAKYLGLEVAAWCFVYGILWILHLKFTPGAQTAAIALAAMPAAAIGAVAWLVARALTALARRGGSAAGRAQRVLRIAAALGAAAVLVGFVVGAAREFGRNPAGEPEGGRSYPVMIIGLDGASWSMIQPLMDEGVMPNLARLVAEGTTGRLRTLLPPIESPTVWTSVATGKRPDKHGIRGFVVKSEETHRIAPVTSDARRATPFWEIVTETGLSVDVVCWYVSWPAEDVSGVFVSERLLFPEVPDIVSPPEWEVAVEAHDRAYMAEQDAQLSRFTPHPRNPDYLSLNENSPEYRTGQHMSILEYSHRKDTVAYETARDLLRRGQPDVFAVYFEGPDRMSHRFLVHELTRRRGGIMQRFYPEIDDAEMAGFGEVFKRYHAQVDAWLGGLLELVDAQTAVIIVSDHGFGVRTQAKLHLRMDPLMAFLGYLERREDGESVDWARTRLYDAHRKTKELGHLAVNLRDREPNGAVARDQMDALVAQARERLEGLETRQGRRVFRSVRVLGDAGAADNAGEIAVELDESCAADTVLVDGRALPVAAFTRNEWMPGNHRIDGIFVGWGGPFQRGAHVNDAGVLDIAPTLLRIAGIPPARDMDGRPLDRAFTSEARASLQHGLVDSYENGRAERAPQRETAAADSLILRQLRTLGYIK